MIMTHDMQYNIIKAHKKYNAPQTQFPPYNSIDVGVPIVAKKIQ